MQILFSEHIREIENFAENSGFSTFSMMNNAGAFACDVIFEKYPDLSAKITLLCGSGNNGGDGFVTAVNLYKKGYEVSVILVDGLPKSENAKKAIALLSSYPIRVYNITDADSLSQLDSANIIIDCIFGIGFHGEVPVNIANLIKYVNQKNAVRIALDLPSGAVCNTGEVFGVCFIANLTITFIAVKPCHILYPSSEYCGKLVCCGLGIPKDKLANVNSFYNIIEDDYVKNNLKKVPKNANKGTNGTCINISGSATMPGAAILSSKSALLSGAGKVKTILHNNIFGIVASSVPEAIYLPTADYSEPQLLKEVINANSVIIGPGCSNSKNFVEFLNKVITNATCPVIIDADGINAISDNINILAKKNCEIIFTPHPKEMSRLLGVSTKYVTENRLTVAKDFAQKYGVTVVLKGANTIIAKQNGECFVCMCGNPGMATAGSGDVLSGIIGGLVACGNGAENSAIMGVHIHAKAGDSALEEKSVHSLIASDIINNLHIPFRKFENL